MGTMRIVDLHTLRADGGWRPFSFLKVTTHEGLTGWSEFAEGSWSPALSEVIRALGRHVIGEDPTHFAKLSAQLHAVTQFTAGGLSHQAVAAIENACIDIAAKARGVPVYALFGGPIRDSVDVYWSHCGSFRARHPDLFEKVVGKPRLKSLDDISALGVEAVARGFKAVKTNPILFGPAGPFLLNPGFVPEHLGHRRGLDEPTLHAIADQTAAMREALGPDRGLMLDVNFSLRPEALRRLARMLEPLRLTWLETDLHDPAALGAFRSVARVPVASLESIYGRRGYKPYFDAQAVDVAIVDVPWNGFAEAMRIAALAETFEVNVAPHNFYGPLADLMSAHFCAAVPNLAVMEFEGDDVPWKSSLLTVASEMRNGQFIIPTGVGWGADVDEKAVAAHPWASGRIT